MNNLIGRRHGRANSAAMARAFVERLKSGRAVKRKAKQRRRHV